MASFPPTDQFKRLNTTVSRSRARNSPVSRTWKAICARTTTTTVPRVTSPRSSTAERSRRIARVSPANSLWVGEARRRCMRTCACMHLVQLRDGLVGAVPSRRAIHLADHQLRGAPPRPRVLQHDGAAVRQAHVVAVRVDGLCVGWPSRLCHGRVGPEYEPSPKGKGRGRAARGGRGRAYPAESTGSQTCPRRWSAPPARSLLGRRGAPVPAAFPCKGTLCCRSACASGGTGSPPSPVGSPLSSPTPPRQPQARGVSARQLRQARAHRIPS